MFKVIIIVCAASLTEIYEDTCVVIDDAWGPYITSENCDIRAKQMVYDFTEGKMNPVFSEIVAMNTGFYPEMIYAEAMCEKTKETQL